MAKSVSFYVVSPKVVVSENLSATLSESLLYNGWKIILWSEQNGTGIRSVESTLLEVRLSGICVCVSCR